MSIERDKFYGFSALTIDGDLVEMSKYEGKLILIVNTASACGMTPQYKGLEDMYQKYKDDGLVILGFPCNQFGGQEQGDETSILEGCVLEYKVTFPMFSKVNVNGKEAHPLYNYLKDALPGLLGKRIMWNFTKFLIDRSGTPIKRYGSKETPAKIEKKVAQILADEAVVKTVD